MQGGLERVDEAPASSPGVIAFGLLAVLALGLALGWAWRGDDEPMPALVVVAPERPDAGVSAAELPQDRAEVLADSILVAFPRYLDAETALTHARAALAAGDATGIDPETLLGMAYVESRFDPAALSWLDCSQGSCRRRTGVWREPLPPPRARPTWYCGALQVGGQVPWSSCLLMRDIPTAYTLGAAHLVEWMGARECVGLAAPERLRCGLRGYNGGWAAIRVEAEVYPDAVLDAARRIR